MRWFRMQRQRIRNTVNSNFVEIKIQFIEPVYTEDKCPRTKRRSKQLSLSVLTQLVITVITQYTPVTTM